MDKSHSFIKQEHKELLVAARERAGLSRRDLAAKLQVSVRAVDGWERPSGDLPSLENWLKAAFLLRSWNMAAVVFDGSPFAVVEAGADPCASLRAEHREDRRLLREANTLWISRLGHGPEPEK